MEAIQGYSKGMNKDSALNKRDPQSYYHALNLRVVTEEGLSAGSLETEKGTVQSFIVPDIEAMMSAGELIPAQANLRIIGWNTLREDIILFTTNETSENPIHSAGQIWRLRYDESSQSVVGLTPTGELNPNIHLIYNNFINFSSAHRIGRSIGRYENTNTQRVYWTDNYNPVRSINIADPNVMDLIPSSLDLTSNVTHVQPNIINVGNGQLPTGCEVQFASRLLSSSGAQTLFSPLSVLVPLTAVGFANSNFNDFEGDGDATQLLRSVTYELTGLDTNFNSIEHIIIIHTQEGVHAVYKFDEDLIPATGNLTVNCTNLLTAVEIPIVEFNMMSSGFSISKDIEVKKNRLIAANNRTTQFEITDFDARAYRFDNSQISKLKGVAGDIYINGSSPDYNIPDIHDCINEYNHEDLLNWDNLQYKYKADGLTLGGEGLNVSYEFTTIELPSNFNIGMTEVPPHISVNTWDNGFGNRTMNVIEKDGTPRNINADGQFQNSASQWVHSNYTGYSRGETYRFGIAFYSKKGELSFVKWIGDIRFPDVEDGFPLQKTVNGFPYLYNLGIKFDVDVSSIKDDISGFSILRLKREEVDKTKLGSGIQMQFTMADKDLNNISSIAVDYQVTGPPQDSSVNAEFTSATSIFGAVEHNNYHLADRPGFHNVNLEFTSSKKLIYLISPLGQFYTPSYVNGDYVKTRGYYQAKVHRYGGQNPNNWNDKEWVFQYRTDDFIANTNKEIFEIKRYRVFRPGEYIYGSDNFISDEFPNNGMMNSSYSRGDGNISTNKNIPMGIGTSKLAILLNGAPTIPHNTGDPSTNAQWDGYYYPSSGINFDFENGPTASGYYNFKEVVYARYIIDQYGGDTYVSRSANKYITTNHYQVIADNLPGTYSFEVYGGDTYVNYYDDEYMEQYWNNDAVFMNPYVGPNHSKLGIALCCPVESTINTNFRRKRHWATNRFGNNTGTYQGYGFHYSKVFSQQNDAEQKYFTKDFLIKLTEEHPHQLWASEPKLDGELIDSWRIFKIANATEVEGIYGPINRIINFKDNLYFFQDSAHGIASLDDRSVITDESGQQLSLGVGGVFPFYQYLSTVTGSVHQFSVAASQNDIFWYDARLKKITTLNGPLSDLKSMSSFFDNEVEGNILIKDKTLQDINEGPIGVHTEVDYRYNRVIFTFLGSKNIVSLESITLKNGYSTTRGVYIYQDGKVYEMLQTWLIPLEDDMLLSNHPDSFRLVSDKSELDFTVTFNELLQAFESFYSFVPNIYLQSGRRLFSVDPKNKNKGYVHNVGNYGEFYEDKPYKSSIHTILCDNGQYNKIFNNISYMNEIYDTNGVDVYNETYNTIRMFSNYQDTGNISLVVDDNIKRRMRTWRYIIPRDITDGKSRLRNQWSHLIMEFDNNSNKRNVLHEIRYAFTPVEM